MIQRSLTLQFIVLLCAASPVWAQSPRASGPFAGLFGGRGQATHTLDLRGSLFAVKQKVFVPPEEREAAELDPRFRQDDMFGGASGSLSYSYNRRSPAGAGFFVNGLGAVSDYSVRPDRPDFSASAGTGVSTNLTQKINFSSSAGASYSPYFAFGSSFGAGAFDPSFVSAAGFDPAFGTPSFVFSAVAQRNVTVDGTVTITDNFTRRSSIGVSGSWREMHVFNGTANDVRTYFGTVNFGHRFTRTLGFHAGYTRGFNQYLGSDVPSTRSDSYDVGLDYGDAFAVPLGRRATLTFGSSTSVVRTRSGTHFRLNGNVGVARAIGRTWNASIGYARGMEFIAAFTEPVLTDSVVGTFGGLIAPRLQWSSSAGISRGQVGFDTTESFTTRSATSGLTYGLFRTLGLYGQYSYYHYEVPPASTTLNLLSTLRRQVISVGLTVWVPIINNGRTARDSR